MKPNGRKYGNRQSHPLPVWNGILDHRERLGGAIWEFLWCLDKITVEKEGVGIVLGGKPIKVEEIVADIPGSDCETVRLHMIHLQEQEITSAVAVRLTVTWSRFSTRRSSVFGS